MKKLTTTFLLLLLSFIMAFSLACNKKPQTSNGESSSESKKEEQLSPIPVTPSGDVNVMDAIEVLNPILNNDYINIAVNYSTKQDGTEMIATVNAYVKRTVRGYDAILNLKVDSKMLGHSVTIGQGSVYYVDGLAVIGECTYDENQSPKWEYSKETVGNVNELLSQLNGLIAQNGSEEYAQILSAVEILKSTIAEMDLKNLYLFTPENQSEMKDVANGVIDFILANENTSIYDIITLYLLGIEEGDTASLEQIENAIKGLVSDNPDVMTLLNRIVSIADAELDVKTIIDQIQTETGISTEDFVNYLKQAFPQFEEIRTDVLENETIFEYVSSYLKNLKVNDLISALYNKEMTATELVENLIEASKYYTLKDLVNGVIGLITESQGSEGVDYFAMISAMNLEFQNLYTKVIFKTDGQGRPTEFSLTNKINITYTLNQDGNPSTELISSETAISALINYVKPMGVSFEIPEDILNLAISKNDKVEIAA